MDNSLSLETINLPLILNGTHTVNAVTGGSMTFNGVISGAAAGITKTGGGTVTLTGAAAGANTYTGATTLNSGTLTLDFSQGGNTPAANIIANTSALSLGGGTLNLIGNSSSASSQTFASTTLASGANVIDVAPASGSTVPTLALGALTYDVGASVVFNGPAYSTGVSTSTGQSGAHGNTATTGVVAATANITTTSGVANQELTGNSTGVTAGSTTAQYAAFATVGLYDYAIVINTSPFTVIGASQGTAQTGTGTGANGTDGAYTVVNGAATGGGSGASGGPWDLVGNCSGHNTDNLTAVRFNALGAATYNAGSGTVSLGGVLVTPNVGANNITMTAFAGGLRSGNPSSVVTWQNNTNGFLIYSGALNDGKTAGTAYVQAGLGTVFYTAASTYTGPTFLNSGFTLITNSATVLGDAAFGAPASAQTLTINGGTVVSSTNVTLDNNGANLRPVVLGNNGGGLAAAAGGDLNSGRCGQRRGRPAGWYSGLERQ